MSIEISGTNEARLKAAAQAEGVSVDAWLERLMNEREELAVIVDRAGERILPLSHEQTRTKIERGFLQSERGEVVDGESYVAGLLTELDVLERKRRTG
jgi:hypothetical protein